MGDDDRRAPGERCRRRPNPTEPPSAEVADLLGNLARIRRRAARDLGPVGVTWSQLRALRAIARGGGPVRMRDLAERLGIARRSATTVVDELAERGLVRRGADATDRRGVTVEVTPAGSALIDDLAAARRRAAAAEMTVALSPGEVRTLRDLLRRVEEAARNR